MPVVVCALGIVDVLCSTRSSSVFVNFGFLWLHKIFVFDDEWFNFEFDASISHFSQFLPFTGRFVEPPQRMAKLNSSTISVQSDFFKNYLKKGDKIIKTETHWNLKKKVF